MVRAYCLVTAIATLALTNILRGDHAHPGQVHPRRSEPTKIREVDSSGRLSARAGATAAAPEQNPLEAIRDKLSSLCDPALQKQRMEAKAEAISGLKQANPPQWGNWEDFNQYHQKLDSSFDWPSRDEDLKKAKEEFADMVADRFKGDDPAAKKTREAMLEQVKNTEVLTYGQFMDQYTKSADGLGIDQETLTGIQSNIGADGFGAMGAVNVGSAGGKNRVIIPPTMLAGALSGKSEGGKQKVDPSALRYVLAHELGHSIDTVNFPGVFSNHRRDLTASFSQSGMAAQALASPETQRELVGDIAFAATLAHKIEKMKAQGESDPAKIRDFLKDAVNKSEHCAELSYSDGVHPSSGFTLDHVVGKFPPLQYALAAK